MRKKTYVGFDVMVTPGTQFACVFILAVNEDRKEVVKVVADKIRKMLAAESDDTGTYIDVPENDELLLDSWIGLYEKAVTKKFSKGNRSPGIRFEISVVPPSEM